MFAFLSRVLLTLSLLRLRLCRNSSIDWQARVHSFGLKDGRLHLTNWNGISEFNDIRDAGGWWFCMSWTPTRAITQSEKICRNSKTVKREASRTAAGPIRQLKIYCTSRRGLHAVVNFLEMFRQYLFWRSSRRRRIILHWRTFDRILIC